jgi:hypothetical protein
MTIGSTDSSSRKKKKGINKARKERADQGQACCNKEQCNIF